MKISIIIPFYNTSKYIERVINSIKSQSYKNYEIICIDDGSTDNTLEILKEFESNNVHVYHQENSGPGLARKNGLKKATGDLIYFMDSDDYLIYDNFFFEINKLFKSNKPDIIMFNLKTLYDDEEIINYPIQNIKTEGMYNIEELRNSTVSAGLYCKVFNKKILKEDMFFDSNVFEDYYTTYRYLDKCKTFYYIKKEMYAVYHKQDNDNHLTLDNSIIKQEKTLDIIIKTYESLSSKELKKSISFYCQNVIVGYLTSKLKREIPKRHSKIMKEYMKKIAKITKDNKLKFEPKSNNKLVKKIIYNYIITIYS